MRGREKCPLKKWRSQRWAVFHAMMWTGALFSPEGLLRACTGREPLATLPWELVRNWGGSRWKVEERKGKEIEGRDRLKKRVNPSVLATFKSPFAHAVPWSFLLPYFRLFACLPSDLLSAGEVS